MRTFPMHALSMALAAASFALPVHAARFTYHGDLMEGDAPANGQYDLRLRSFASTNAKATAAGTTELPGVSVRDGRFAVELDLPENQLGDTYVEVAVRRTGSHDKFEVLGAPQPVAKVNGACPGAWALDGNSGAPAGSFLGFADEREVLINSPVGVALNKAGVILDGSTDLQIHSKSNGDVDADLRLVSRNNKSASAYVRDDSGNLVISVPSGRLDVVTGLSDATLNNGQAPFLFQGRLRSYAVGPAPTDTSGGIWFDDERANASFVGRGDNQSNWTGIYEATGGWRFSAHDNGAFGFNTGTQALTANEFKVKADAGVRVNTFNFPVPLNRSMTVGPLELDDGTATLVLLAPVLPGDSDPIEARITMQAATPIGTRPLLSLGLEGENQIVLDDDVGIKRPSFANALEVNGNASKTTAGDWLANSDRRIKHDIQPIANALDTIMKLRPVTFRYDAAYRAENNGLDAKRYYNVVAQEFAEVFPDAVKGSGEHLTGKPKTKDNEILQVDTYPAQITAIAAIQELAVADDNLRGELARVRSENAALRAQLDAVLGRLSRLEAER